MGDKFRSALGIKSGDDLCGFRQRFGDETADAFVVEDCWHASGCNENRYAVAKHQGLRMVDLEFAPAHHFHRKRLKGGAALESA